jgi:hypothetical protein
VVPLLSSPAACSDDRPQGFTIVRRISELTLGVILRGWARSACGITAEGIPWIEHGIKDLRAAGSMLERAPALACKAEALHLADRTPEALEAINEALAIVERFDHGCCSAELHPLHGVFLRLWVLIRPAQGSAFAAIVRQPRKNPESPKESHSRRRRSL